jgi:hypothetical protein
MRDLEIDGVLWSVREVDAARVPGARGERCLLFETEGVIRRVWSYPDDWRSVPDETLRILAERRALPRPTERSDSERSASESAEPPALADARVVTDRTRSLLDQVSILRDTMRPARDEQRDLLEQCCISRRQMHDAIAAYAEALRREGVPPERAIVQLKSAMQQGLAGACCDEPVAEELMHDGIEWCIAAYYAA